MPGRFRVRGFPLRVWLTGALFCAFVASFAAYVYSERQIDQANEQRYRSRMLADQLRRSSDDLTRMVRTYVATSDPAYKQAYLDILDIRDGRRVRPDNYENIYWDLALVQPRYARPEIGPGVPLLELMHQAGFSREEFDTLAEAKTNSDALTAREFQAMRLVESGGPEAQANRMKAILMVQDDTYHQAKAAIMRPIDRFYALVEGRTLATVHHAEAVAQVLRLTFIAFTVAVGIFLWRTHAESRAILGGSVAEVHDRITRISRGDFAGAAAGPTGATDSVLAGLVRMAAELEGVEAERARAAAELRDKNEALQRSNADLEQFAYVASHDLQTPLRNIVSYAQLLERRYKGQLDGDADDFIGFIVDSSKRLTRLIGDLLQFARITSQGSPLHPIPAGEAVSHALANLKAEVERTGAKVDVGPLPQVMAEQSQLVSLFQNLMGNALKYHAPDRVPHLAVAAEPAGPGQWRFAVSDNGIGIDSAYHDKIFEIFQRLDPGADTEGTGIGLTLCRRIVHRFGGTIEVDSVPGQGTTFFFTLADGAAGG